MSSSHQSTTMSLERGPENYRELGTTFLMYSALSSFVSGKGSMSNPLRHGQDMVSQSELKNRFYQVDYDCFLPSLDPCIQIALCSKTLYTFPVICYINR